MIGSLVARFARGAGREGSGRGSGPARRFTPQVEALETRVVPGGCPGGVLGRLNVTLLAAKVSGPSHEISLGSQPAGVGQVITSGLEALISRSAGEEIPQ